HLAQPDAPRDRRGDVAVGKIDLGGLDLRLVRLDRSLILLHQRPLRIQLLLRDGILLDQLLEALQVQPGIREERLIFTQRALGLRQGRLVGPRIDLREELALLDQLAFLEGDLLQLAADLGAYRYGGERRDRPQRRNANLDIAHADRGGRYRDRLVLIVVVAVAAEAAGAAEAPVDALLRRMDDVTHHQIGQSECEHQHDDRYFAPAHQTPQPAHRRRLAFLFIHHMFTEINPTPCSADTATVALHTIRSEPAEASPHASSLLPQATRGGLHLRVANDTL